MTIYMLARDTIYKLTETGTFKKTVIMEEVPSTGYVSVNNNISLKELRKIFEEEGRIFSDNVQSLISMRELLD